MPKLEVPPQVAEKKPRLFELRAYEAHSRKANKKKVEMFDTATGRLRDKVLAFAIRKSGVSWAYGFED